MALPSWPVPALFPAGVEQHGATFDGATDAQLDELGVPLPEAVRRSAPARRRAFVAGRVCAREALRRLLGAADVPEVAVGEGGAPMWPPGVVGSITHGDALAAAAVARASDVRALGLDLERVVTAEVAAELAPVIAHPGEVEAAARAGGVPVAAALTIVFAAKEALYKCLWPIVRHRFDFLDATVAFPLGGEPGALSARAFGIDVAGRYARYGEYVVSAVLLP